MSGLIRHTFRRARDERLPQVAGSLTFTSVLALVPLLAVGFALFLRVPAFRRPGAALQQQLLAGLLPPEIAGALLKHLGRFAANASSLPWVGFLFVAASALAMLLTAENALNRIWQVKKPRPLPRRLGLFLVALLVGPPVLGASLWATSTLLAASSGRAAALGPAAVLALQLLPVLLTAAGLACVFRYVPHAPVGWGAAATGGVLAGLALEGGKRGLAWYLHQVPTYKALYGAFAVLPVFLLWVYFSWLVVLGAALVAANLSRPGRPAPRGRAARAQ